MITTAYAVSHVGLVRPANEDRVVMSSFMSHGSSEVAISVTSDESRRLDFGVIDGMGGHVGGAVASEIVARRFIESIDGEITQTLAAANAALYERMAADPTLTAMGATAVLCSVASRRAHLINVGDARAYHLSEGCLMLVSQDDRLPGSSNVLTQSLGGQAAPSPISPHSVDLDIEPGERLLLCSDGLSEMVGFDQIEATLTLKPEVAIYALLELALAAGAEDNVSIIVASFEEEAVEDRA